jgi:UDP-N-acetylmuramate dehydrogenase
MGVFDDLRHCIRERVPMAPHTSYRLGGPAEYLATPRTASDLSAVLARARAEGVPVRVLGHGTNLLIGDNGVQGMIIHLPKDGFAGFDLDPDAMLLRVGAGQSLAGTVNWTLARGWNGLEFLAGVPGTVGAALRMNAGGRYGQIGDRVSAVSGVQLDGTPFRAKGEDCGFVYRDSQLQDCLVTQCQLRLHHDDVQTARDLFKQILAEKQTSQPLAARSAGCVFKNPKVPGVPPAGKLIEELGFKGQQVGGARVSQRHANFLVCEEGACTADVLELIRRIRAKAWGEYGVRMELEIAVWGVPAEALWPEELRALVA